MKRLLVFITLLFLLVKPAYAQGNELLSSDQVIDSDYFRSGQSIQIDGEIHGDAFLIGALVTVNGKVDGDLFIIAGKAVVNGPVGNSVRILAADTTINSSVGRNVLLGCANCSISKQSAIEGSVLVGGANLELSASRIGRGFRFFGNRLYLNSEIKNEAFVVADREFLLGPQASISADLKYSGNSEAVLEYGATVAGNISYQKTSSNEGYPRFFGAREVLSSYKKVKPVVDVLSFGVSALIGFILLGLFPKIFEKTVMAMENKPAASFGWGTIVVLLMPLVAVLFAITVVGIPVSFVLVLLGYGAWIMSQYISAFFIGRKIMLKKFGERRGWALLLGLFIIYLVGLVPIIGNVFKVVFAIFTLGAVILAYRQKPIIEHRLVIKRGRGRPRKAI
ncbi:hypothetical protein HY310_00950 [Candidatus Microgenomates bacterium]|nr:hypothetical protein [Candidatus Microgenomates bacterium]